MAKYFISYIWWHAHRPEDKNIENITTDKSPVDWLLEFRKFNKDYAQKHNTGADQVFILFYMEISEEDYKKAQDAELGK